MDNLHIPPEVVEATRKALWKFGMLDAPPNVTTDVLRAAFTAWVECGMAKPAFGYYSEYLVERGWGIFTETETPQTESVLIIRTKEAT
jgi:hypothetical protein